MKKILMAIAACLFIAAAFAQDFKELQTRKDLSDISAMSQDSSVSKIPACFCCDGAYNLAKPIIQGLQKDINCGQNVNYSIASCSGATVSWSIAPSIPFTGNGTSSINVSFPSTPSTVYTIAVTVRCGRASVSSSITVQPCKRKEKTVEITTGIDAPIHCLASMVKTNLGTIGFNIVSNWTFLGTDGIISSAIQFPLPSDLTSTSIISSAKLYLYDYCDPSNGSNLYTYPATHATAYNSGFNVKRITSPWAENTISCSNAPTSTSAGQITVNAVSLPSYVQGQDNQIISVTTLVGQMVTSGNYGFLLELQDTNPAHPYRARSYGSFNNTNASLRPKLVITYTP